MDLLETLRTNPEKVDPKLGRLVNRMRLAAELALEKVVAHHQDPGTYPLPSNPKSLERVFNKAFSSLPDRKQKDVVDKFAVRIKASETARAQIYGDLATVPLRSAEAIADQVKRMKAPPDLRFTKQELRALEAKFPARAPVKVKKPTVQIAPTATALDLILIDLTCDKPSEIRRDEILFGASVIGGDGSELTVSPFFVGKFKKNETITTNRLLATAPLGAAFPQDVVVSLFLIDKDLYDEEQLKTVIFPIYLALVSFFLGLCVAGVIIPLPFSIPVLMVIAILGAVLAILPFLMIRMTNDISAPSEDVLTLDAPVQPGTEFERTVTISGGLRIYRGDEGFGGKYSAAFEWVAR